MMCNTLWQNKFPESGVLWLNFYLLAIQIIVGMNLPTQCELVALLAKIKGKRLIDRYEPALAAFLAKGGTLTK